MVDVNKVASALSMANAASQTPGGWAKVEEVNVFGPEVGLEHKVNTDDLDDAVDGGLAERMETPGVVKDNYTSKFLLYRAK